MEEFSGEFLQFLIRNSLTARQILLLDFIYNEKIELAMEYINFCEQMETDDFYKLELLGLIKLNNPSKKYYISAYNVTDHFLSVAGLKPKTKSVTVDDWIDEWFDLFPKGIKTGGKYVRTDKLGCTKRMKDFVKMYPHFSKDLIIEATAKYIEDRERNDYNYFMLAPYFIRKDGLSSLASWCEQIQDESSEVAGDDPFINKV